MMYKIQKAFFQPHFSRRIFFSKTSNVVISTAALLLLANISSASETKDKLTEGDFEIIEGALAAEQEMKEAYKLFIDLNLLQSQTQALALDFLEHHNQHASMLHKKIVDKGGNNIEQSTDYDFPIEDLKTEKDILTFAADLEMSIAIAYIDAIKGVKNKKLRYDITRTLAVETMHWATLRKLLGIKPVPFSFFS